MDVIVVNEIYDKIKHWTQGTSTITASSICAIIIEIIQLTERVYVNGYKKKLIAITVINKLINDSNQPNKEELLKIVKYIVPTLIDTLIAVDKSGLFNKKIDKCLGRCL